jgi:cytochrome c oxidase assembly protein subunit 15
MPASTVLQAIIGGITVRTGLLWWTVSIHLLVSMAMVWLAALLYVKVGEPDDGVVTPVAPKPLRQLTVLTAVVLSATLVTGTLVTGAGPHAGDKSLARPVPRLQVEIVTLVHAHATLMVAYFSLLVGLSAGLLAVGAPRRVLKRLAAVLALVLTQGLIGVVQYHTGVPALLVALHVAGAAACTAATAVLWASMRQRTETQAVQRRLDLQSEVALP